MESSCVISEDIFGPLESLTAEVTAFRQGMGLIHPNIVGSHYQLNTIYSLAVGPSLSVLEFASRLLTYIKAHGI